MAPHSRIQAVAIEAPEVSVHDALLDALRSVLRLRIQVLGTAIGTGALDLPTVVGPSRRLQPCRT